MNPIRITAVSYLNTLPFIYGITQSGLLNNYELSLEVPSLCAKKLLNNETDLSLVPVGALPMFKKYELVGKYCIGAHGDVMTVLLLSNDPVQQLRTVYLDEDSLTSVRLVRILAKRYWNITPHWKGLQGIDPASLKEGEGMVIIGDKTFGTCEKYKFCYDLSGAWHQMTGLPFVFAAWISNEQLPPDFIIQFNAALAWGVAHSRDSVILAKKRYISDERLVNYLEKDISYPFDSLKEQALKQFLEWVKEDQLNQ